ncbi:MFS transporter [Paenibacillus sp. WQ 127069]|uniref:MFS transporter n=1 Tax=Paenibacillus baimaensis TaxID=2982185 RepID=A0ABT2UIB1_9BACL|nr:MFS transporter [Paenibacillus sp. WQ 127069]MCU6794387.1 MFS transporter [Paenibacillus sp. WQ 127069]
MLEATNKKANYTVLLAISLAHFINDALQAVIPASYPILRDSLHLTYTQIGIITFILYFSSSVMQPFVGMFADKRPTPYLLPIGMIIALIGMLGLAFAPAYAVLLAAVGLVGVASAVFHPEGARIAYLAGGERRGLAQSIFQVGGNSGGAMAPLMTALIFFPFGQFGAVWFTMIAAIGMMIQLWVAQWYRQHLLVGQRKGQSKAPASRFGQHEKKIKTAIIIILLIAFARSWFGASISTYFSFYLLERFQMTVPEAQIFLFIYMGAGIIGTFFGGPLSDRIGRKNVILLSVLGSAPFAMLLPHVGEIWVYPLLFLLGIINHSSFSVTVVYVQELVPGKVGTVSGLITGLSFGLGAVGAVALGGLIDLTSLTIVITACSFMPLIGALGLLLPSDKTIREWSKAVT